jgi:adenine/guanine phosphoribosyltransferase-like PRPP-binding protein
MKAPVHLTMLEIVDRLHRIDLPEIDLILGIASGGIVPASILAYKQQKPMQLIHINYRDVNNKPQFKQPQLMEKFHIEPMYRRILIVDDVSVTGSTLRSVKELLENHQVWTFTLKGKADFVLFPEISSCVAWPWKFK